MKSMKTGNNDEPTRPFCAANGETLKSKETGNKDEPARPTGAANENSMKNNKIGNAVSTSAGSTRTLGSQTFLIGAILMREPASMRQANVFKRANYW